MRNEFDRTSEEYFKGMLDGTVDNETFNEYMENLKNVAFLIHCKTLLINYRCTKEEKEKIEYALEKVFNICYSEELKTYI